MKSVVSIPEYFDAEHSVATALFEHGCLHDVEVKLLQLLYLGTKLAIPYRVIQPLNFFYYLKLRTTNDQEKLKGLGAMLALLFGVRFIFVYIWLYDNFCFRKCLISISRLLHILASVKICSLILIFFKRKFISIIVTCF